MYLNRFISIVACFTAAVVGISALAQQRQQESSGNAGDQLEQAKQQILSEYRRQGDQEVEVPQRAIWVLGMLPPELMHQAVRELSEDPEAASTHIMQAANILQLHSALARGDAADRLQRAAQALNETALDVSLGQSLATRQLREPFAEASLAMARFYQQYADRGLERGDQEITGYSLKGASQYLSSAHTFAGNEPSPQTSLALYNARILGQQIVQSAKPTTYATARQGDGARGDAEQAAAREGRATLPEETQRVIADLNAALDEVTAEMDRGQADQRQQAEDMEE